MHSRKPKSFRLNKELNKRVLLYLEMNSIKTNTLINLAIEKFISEPNTVKMRPVYSKDLENSDNKTDHKNNVYAFRK